MFWDKQNKEQELKIKTQLAEASQKYKRVFGGEDGEWVLNDLAKRSFENTTTYDPDEKKMFMNEGRRSLFKHIKKMVAEDLSEILGELTKGV